MSFDVELGALLTQQREALGISQRDVARQVKAHGHPWHQQTVARVESGARPVRVSELGALAAALHLEPEVFVAGNSAAMIREWPRTARLSPDVPEVADYLGQVWTQISLDRWESADGQFEVPFAYLAEQWGPLRELTP